MVKSKRPAKRAKRDQKSGTSEVRNSRATVSGPSTPDPVRFQGDLAAKHAGTQDLAAAIPYNAHKPAEYDSAAAIAPAVAHDEPLVTSSTVTESIGSDKVGSGSPTLGTNKTVGSLRRGRIRGRTRETSTLRPRGGSACCVGPSLQSHQHSL